MKKVNVQESTAKIMEIIDIVVAKESEKWGSNKIDTKSIIAVLSH